MVKTGFLTGLIVLAVSLPSYGVQFSSILPANRSVQVGSQASFFGTILNTSSLEAKGCAIFLASPIDAWFSYQATNTETNAPIAAINTPVSISANSSQPFVLTLTPASVIAPIDVRFTYSCDGERDVDDIDGVNTLLFSASSQPVPDIVTLSTTVTANGIAELVQGETGFFTLSTMNLGTSGMFEVIPRVTGAEYVNVVVCQTDPITSKCFSNPEPTVKTVIGEGETPTFALFLTAADLIELDASTRRVFVEFRDESGQVRGSTSVAVLSAQDADPNVQPEPGPAPEPAPIVERTVRVTWGQPEQNSEQPAAYVIHVGAESGNYTKSFSANPVDNAKDITLGTGVQFLSMTAESASGDRSAHSPELEILVR